MGGGDTSARSRSLNFVEEDEDGGEMREVTYGERERRSTRTITIRVQEERKQLTKESKDVHYLGFRTVRDSLAVTRRRYTCP